MTGSLCHASAPHELRVTLAAWLSVPHFLFSHISSWPIKTAAVRAEENVLSGPIRGEVQVRVQLGFLLALLLCPWLEPGKLSKEGETWGSGPPILLYIDFPHDAKNSCSSK